MKRSHGLFALAVQSLARETGGDVQELLTLYVLEALLSRVAISKFREDSVLKGGVLLATFDLRRPTKDIDLQAAGIPNDLEAVTTRIKEIAAMRVDGVTCRQVCGRDAPGMGGRSQNRWAAVLLAGGAGSVIQPSSIYSPYTPLENTPAGWSQ